MKRRFKQSATTPTFSVILAVVSQENAVRLVDRISAADKLAKSLRGRSRARLYGVKKRALTNLTMRLWEYVPLLDEPVESPFVLVTQPPVRLNSGHVRPAPFNGSVTTDGRGLKW